MFIAKTIVHSVVHTKFYSPAFPTGVLCFRKTSFDLGQMILKAECASECLGADEI